MTNNAKSCCVWESYLPHVTHQPYWWSIVSNGLILGNWHNFFYRQGVRIFPLFRLMVSDGAAFDTPAHKQSIQSRFERPILWQRIPLLSSSHIKQVKVWALIVCHCSMVEYQILFLSYEQYCMVHCVNIIHLMNSDDNSRVACFKDLINEMIGWTALLLVTRSRNIHFISCSFHYSSVQLHHYT